MIMKKIIYLSIAVLLNMLCLVSCDREKYDYGYGEDGNETLATGTVNLASLKVAVSGSVVGVTTRAGESDEQGSINVDDYIILIHNKDGKSVKQWKYSEMPEIFSLNVGSYTVSAYSHDEKPAEFDRPYYFGSQDFEIKADSVTNIDELKCFLRSIMVTVEYDDDLKEILGDDVVSKVTVGDGSLDFVKGESRAGYFQATNSTSNMIDTEFTGTVDGAQVNYAEKFSGVKAGEHRIIRYSVKKINNENNGTGGTAEFTITIDATCTVVNDTIEIDPGSEDIIPDFPSNGGDEDNSDNNNSEDNNSEKPSIVGNSYEVDGQGFDISKDVLDIPSGVSTIVKVDINAPKGISHVKVEIISDVLTPEELESVGLTDKFDLAEPGEYETALSRLGFPVKDEVIGQTYLLFDITQFTGLLANLDAGEHNFKITVVDSEGNEKTETLKLKTY